jgi:hypothetical protein
MRCTKTGTPFVCQFEHRSGGVRTAGAARAINLSIHAGEIEIELASVFGLEGDAREFPDHVAFCRGAGKKGRSMQDSSPLTSSRH